MSETSSVVTRHSCPSCGHNTAFTFRNFSHIHAGCWRASCDYSYTTFTDFQQYKMWRKMLKRIVSLLRQGYVIRKQELSTFFDANFRHLIDVSEDKDVKHIQAWKYSRHFRYLEQLLAEGMELFHQSKSKVRLHGGYRGDVIHAPGVDPASEPIDLKALVLEFFIPKNMIQEIWEEGVGFVNEQVERLHIKSVLSRFNTSVKKVASKILTQSVHSKFLERKADDYLNHILEAQEPLPERGNWSAGHAPRIPAPMNYNPSIPELLSCLI